MPTGAVTVGFEFAKTGPLRGNARLVIDGRVVAEQAMGPTLARISLESLRVGRSGLPEIVPDYEGTFPFAGTIRRVVYELGDDAGPRAAPIAARK